LNFIRFIFLLILFSSTSLFAKRIEVVFCADFSGSTNGMVTELQKTIWSSMNQIQEKDSVQIEFGLIGYGRKSFHQENNYVKVIHPLGSPVNEIGYSLVKLQVIINSCETYPQKALSACIKKIKWSEDNVTKRIIVFIGNGEVELKSIEKEFLKAKKKGISIQPIFYQRSASSARGRESWKKFAKLTGNDLIIAQPALQTVSFKKYYDEAFIVNAGAKLMSTYLPIGSKGKLKMNQLNKIIDKLKISSLENYEEMLIFQSSPFIQGKYDWDMVDLYSRGEFELKDLNIDDFPVFLQSLPREQLLGYVQLKLKVRQIVVSKLRLELDKRNEYMYRKKEKSKYMVGRGGLSNIICLLLLDHIALIK